MFYVFATYMISVISEILVLR